MTEPILHILANEEQMNRVNRGELVLLTFGHDQFGRAKSFWTVFDGYSQKGDDRFVAQSDIDPNIINVFVAPRSLHEYNDSGINLCAYKVVPILPNKALYLISAEKLQKAGLWQDPREYTGVRIIDIKPREVKA